MTPSTSIVPVKSGCLSVFRRSLSNIDTSAYTTYSANGTAITDFSVAATERYTDRSGQRQERTEWINVVLWGKRGEALAKIRESAERSAFGDSEIETLRKRLDAPSVRASQELLAIALRVQAMAADAAAGDPPTGG
mgnify:CR=1 FL=1